MSCVTFLPSADVRRLAVIEYSFLNGFVSQPPSLSQKQAAVL
jgi:hypothetical protein